MSTEERTTIPYTLARVCEGQGGWAALLTCDICGATVTEDAYNSAVHPAVDKHTAWHEANS
jgi:hypothetical protein